MTPTTNHASLKLWLPRRLYVLALFGEGMWDGLGFNIILLEVFSGDIEPYFKRILVNCKCKLPCIFGEQVRVFISGKRNGQKYAHSVLRPRVRDV